MYYLILHGDHEHNLNCCLAIIGQEKQRKRRCFCCLWKRTSFANSVQICLLLSRSAKLVTSSKLDFSAVFENNVLEHADGSMAVLHRFRVSANRK